MKRCANCKMPIQLQGKTFNRSRGFNLTVFSENDFPFCRLISKCRTAVRFLIDELEVHSIAEIEKRLSLCQLLIDLLILNKSTLKGLIVKSLNEQEL